MELKELPQNDTSRNEETDFIETRTYNSFDHSPEKLKVTSSFCTDFCCCFAQKIKLKLKHTCLQILKLLLHGLVFWDTKTNDGEELKAFSRFPRGTSE